MFLYLKSLTSAGEAKVKTISVGAFVAAGAGAASAKVLRLSFWMLAVRENNRLMKAILTV